MEGKINIHHDSVKKVGFLRPPMHGAKGNELSMKANSTGSKILGQSPPGEINFPGNAAFFPGEIVVF